MYYRNENKIVYFTPLKLNDDEISKLNLSQGNKSIVDSITKIDDNYYFYKKVSTYEMINELIGSYMCKEMELDAVDYKIGKLAGEVLYYALSKVFYEEDYIYSYCYKYFGDIGYEVSDIQNSFKYFKYCNTNILNKVESYKMISDILKLTLIDLKMGQCDRDTYSNLMLKISKTDEKMELAPIYDFGRAYCDDFYNPNPNFYINPFIALRKNKRSLLEFSTKYPEIRDFTKTLVDLQIGDVLGEISKQKGIIFNSNEINYYHKKDKEYTKLLKKML